MTTNQTIDGVPVFYAIDPLDAYPEPVGTDDKIERSNGALWVHLNGKRSKLIGLQSLDFLISQLVQIKGEVFGTEPAAQAQGDPVAYRIGVNGEWFYGDKLSCIRERVEFESTFTKEDFEEAGVVTPEPLYAEQPAPVAVVPEGYCIMPRQLTAENGAKALLLGEFNLQVTMECPECCDLEEPTEGCSICDGEGEYGQKHTIPWDKIKFIYSKAVSGLAVKAEPAKSR